VTRARLLLQLESYLPLTAEEAEMRGRLAAFVAGYENCFERSLTIGHITGSGWIVSLDRRRVLLHHHGKLDKWLQLGGHADGEPDPLAVALREAREESGLAEIAPVSTDIFDVDVHSIPARKYEAAHDHYDVRYLLEADDATPLMITEESKDLQWVLLEQVPHLTLEESVLRMLRKTLARFER